jgi:hypothetical protein
LLVGCHATVSLQSVTGVSASDLQRAELCIRADAPTAVAGNAPELKPGHPACGNAGEESTFFLRLAQRWRRQLRRQPSGMISLVWRTGVMFV